MADQTREEAERALFEAAVERFARSGGAAEQRAKEGAAHQQRSGGAGLASSSVAAGGARPRSRRRASGDPGAGADGGEIAARLDLHGLDVEEAGHEVDRFLARQRRATTVLVVHGIGTRRLARAVRMWLDQDGRVRRHESAPPRLGGAGARVVCLR